MIAQLTGKIVSLNFTELILDVNGVGYFVSIPMSTYDVLLKAGEGGTATVLTWLQVREEKGGARNLQAPAHGERHRREDRARDPQQHEHPNVLQRHRQRRHQGP